MTVSRLGMRMMSIAAVILPLVASTTVHRQSAPAEPPRCEAPEHRQFDFWIGRWEVSAADGRVLGHSAITKTLDGCVIHERWTGGGVQGESFNIWDRASRRWHQTWVSSTGQLLLLDGAFGDGAMQMSGESGPPDRRVLNRITWTPAKDGGLTQRCDVSQDRGATWRVVFDGTYRRKPAGQEERSPE